MILILMLLTTLNIQAQNKKWEHNIYVGAGLMMKSEDSHSHQGLSLKAGYGLGYFFNGQWSVMPGLAVRNVEENPFAEAADGADEDGFTILDVPIVARYNVGNGTGSFTFGLGPVLSFCIDNETYYIDADPSSPLNKLNKCKTFSVGLQPSISYQMLKHLSIGLDGYYCLTNIKDTHGLTGGSKHIHDVTAKIIFLF